MIGERINITTRNNAGGLGEAGVPGWFLCLFVMGSAFLEVGRVAGHVYTPVMESRLISNRASFRIRTGSLSCFAFGPLVLQGPGGDRLRLSLRHIHCCWHGSNCWLGFEHKHIGQERDS